MHQRVSLTLQTEPVGYALRCPWHLKGILVGKGILASMEHEVAIRGS
jgi:hypothetical protein